MRSVDDTIRLSGRLDARFHWMRDGVERSKEQSLRDLARILAEEGVEYALIGGVAVQVYRVDPRTTLDIDLVVRSYDHLPRARLTAAGFRCQGRFEWTENWVGPDGTPVLFTDEAQWAEGIQRAEVRAFGTTTLRIAAVVDLIRAKLRAAADPARRRSKRLQDLADAAGLAEDHPEVAALLTEAERSRLDRAT